MIKQRDSGGEVRPCEECGAGGKESPFPAEERLLEKKVRAAKRVISFEALWPRIWLPVSVCGVFVLFSAFEVWQFLPPRVHYTVLCGFGVALLLSFIPLALWRRPSREQALSRLEQASELAHRPLTAFNDTISRTDTSPETAALWEAHRARAAETLRKLKTGAPHPRVDRYDPFALRAALVLMLVVIAASSSADLRGRMLAAFKIPEIPPGADFRLDVWVTPPPYTHKEPVVLANGTLSAPTAKSPVAVPVGSLLTVKINGDGAKDYTVSLAAGGKQQELSPTGQSGGNFEEYAQKIEQGGKLSIRHRHGSETSWTLAAVPDRAPKIAFAGPIEVSQRSTMLFKYKVEDDYGVVSAEARIERIAPNWQDSAGGTPPTPQIGKPPVFPLSLPRSPIRSAEAKTYKDLTAHPWAGLPVVVTLTAKDETGQEGRSAQRGLILPERKFTKPLAKAIIDQRRALVENPANANTIAGSLSALALTAEDDGIAVPVYLSLRSSYWRLRGRPSIDQVESVVDQLWDVAIRIEDGNLSTAERDLRAAQDKLKEALERGASQEEIQKLMAELRSALSRYLQALAQQQGSSSGSKEASTSRDTKTITPQELQQLLNKIESLAKAGSADAAAQMLNQLRDILESLQASKGREGQSQEEKENLQRLDRLTNLMRQQQQLLDQTFRAQQQGEESGAGEDGQRGENGAPGQQPRSGGRGGQSQAQGGAAGLKQRQDDLQRQLQQLLGEMAPGKDGDAIRQKLQEAEEAMGEAGESLDANELGAAGDQEARALDSLKQGSRAMAEQMMRSSGANGGQASRDPLGRQQGGQLSDPGDSVKVPDEITVQRAREILDELRKRLGEPSRPPVELEYLERLIKPY